MPMCLTVIDNKQHEVGTLELDGQDVAMIHQGGDWVSYLPSQSPLYLI